MWRVLHDLWYNKILMKRHCAFVEALATLVLVFMSWSVLSCTQWLILNDQLNLFLSYFSSYDAWNTVTLLHLSSQNMERLSMLAFHPVKMQSCYEKVEQLNLEGLQQRFDVSSPSVFVSRAQILMGEVRRCSDFLLYNTDNQHVPQLCQDAWALPNF